MPAAASERRRSISAQSSGSEQAISRRRLLLDPAEGGDVLVGAEQDPGLAGAGLGGEVGLPLGQRRSPPRPSQRAMLRRAAAAHRVLEDRQREAVDLEHDQARARRSRSARPAGGRPGGRPAACTRRRRWCPTMTVSTIVAAAITSAASSASPNESTRISSGKTSSARTSAPRVDQRTSDEAERERERQPQRRDDRRQDAR